MAEADYEQRMRELQRQYVDFLDDSDRDGVYDRLVRDMIENKGSRLVVSINDLRNQNKERAFSLRQRDRGLIYRAICFAPSIYLFS